METKIKKMKIDPAAYFEMLVRVAQDHGINLVNYKQSFIDLTNNIVHMVCVPHPQCIINAITSEKTLIMENIKNQSFGITWALIQKRKLRKNAKRS